MRAAIPRALGLAVALTSPAALADGPGDSPKAPAAVASDPGAPSKAADPLSSYEKTSLALALARVGGAVDPNPDGKIVESVEIVPFEVFEERDFIPEIFLGFANWFHVTSKPYVIKREVLQLEGQRYDRALVAETERNLRATRQVSLVLAVPIEGSAPGRVKLLVVTKDIWSLRLNSDFSFSSSSGKLTYLLLEPSEENFLGTHQSLSARFVTKAGAVSLGAHYIIPRIAGSRIRSDLAAGVIVNNATGHPEGSYGDLFYGQPLYSTKSTWAWGATAAWRYEVARRYVSGRLDTFPSKKTPGDDAIPWVYRSDTLNGRFEVTRSFGSAIKNDVTVGVSAVRNVYRTDDLSAFAPKTRADFLSTAVPVSDTRIGPYLQLRSHANRYVTRLDVETLGLQENFIAGHDAYLKLSPVTQALGSSRNFLGVFATASYSIPLGDGLAKGYVQLSNELTTSGIPDGSIDAGLRIATPRTPIGRLHFDGFVLNRYANYLNLHSSLGGESRPRGYPTNAFHGKDAVAATLEYRSRAAQILSCQLGGALFYDLGDAANGLANLRIKQSAGFGVRILFPQLDRIVMRVDWGFPLPLVVPAGAFPGDIVVTFRQAFEFPVLPVTN